MAWVQITHYTQKQSIAILHRNKKKQTKANQPHKHKKKNTNVINPKTHKS